MTLRPGKSVELLDGDFLRIKSIWQDAQTTEVILRGPLMRRTRKLEGLMARKLNETCWVKEVFLDGSSDLDDVPLGSVLRIRQLRMTNKPFNEFNVSHTQGKSASPAIKESEGILFCRYQYCSVYMDQAQKKKESRANFSEKFLSSLEPEDVDEGWLADIPNAPRRGQSQLGDDDDLRIISENGTEILVGDPPQVRFFMQARLSPLLTFQAHTALYVRRRVLRRWRGIIWSPTSRAQNRMGPRKRYRRGAKFRSEFPRGGMRSGLRRTIHSLSPGRIPCGRHASLAALPQFQSHANHQGEGL